MRTFFFPVALCCVFWAGCVRTGAVGPGAERPRYVAKEDAKADEALEAAKRAEATSRPERAIEAYLAVTKAFPETTAAQEALYRAGVLAFEAGDYVTARRSMNQLLLDNPLFDGAKDAQLKLGLSALELGAYQDALQTLQALADKLTGEERRSALEASIRAAEGAQLFTEALRLSLRLGDEAQTPEERQAALVRLEELVEGRASFLDVAKSRAELPSSHPAWPLFTFKLARIYYHLRDWPRLEETLREFLREAPAHAFAPQAKELLERAGRRAQVRPKVVGAVLPLTGRYKPLGEAVLRGIELALRGSEVELIVKDSQGDVNLAGKQVEELALDEGAIAVLGPLLADDSRRAAVVADELEVPIITLTRAEGITAIGPRVFRNMLTNSQQAKALADYAIGTLGYKSFAMLYPDIPFGQELTGEFWDEVVARGGEVRGAESYEHDQTTFTSEVKKLVGRFYLEDRTDYLEKYREISSSNLDAYRKRKAVEKLRSSLEPVVDFEALLIPDSWQRVGLVAPALAVEDLITNACDPKDLEKIKKATGKKQLKTVTLLGTNTWSSPKGRTGLPELVERGGKFVTCSVYVDGFFADSKRPATRKFVSAFGEAYKGSAPTLLEASGFDSAGMLRHLIEKEAPQSRAQLRDRLSALVGYEGATGTTRFDDKREAQKPLFLLSVDSTGVQELTVAPKAGGGT